MRLITPLFKHIVYPGLSKTGYLRRRRNAGPAVVTYHGILPEGYKVIDPIFDGNLVSADSFRRQLRLLKDRYNLLSPEAFLHWIETGDDLPLRSVLLTCDDGLKNSLDMLPLLQREGASCLFFVTGACLAPAPTMLGYEELYLMLLAAPEQSAVELPEVGVYVRPASRQEQRPLWQRLIRELSRFDFKYRRILLEKMRVQLGLPEQWSAKYNTDPVLKRRFALLTQQELRQLANAGMTVGAHTMSHPVLSQCSRELAWSEISESKHGLERALGQEVWALAYPFGDSTSVTSRELQISEQARFTCAFLNVSGHAADASAFAFPRINITGEMTLAEFEAHVSGFHRSMHQLFKRSNTDELGASA
jgi:peptidoglycan/xylan/chitin deacetylase (PgdA/CDA1 family)